jgi:hypothetical protein
MRLVCSAARWRALTFAIHQQGEFIDALEKAFYAHETEPAAAVCSGQPPSRRGNSAAFRWNLPTVRSFSRTRWRMAYEAILQRIRLLIPPELDGHYNAICRGFEEGDLTAPSLSISQMQLARAITEFTGYPPNEASIATLERRLNPQY